LRALHDGTHCNGIEPLPEPERPPVQMWPEYAGQLPPGWAESKAQPEPASEKKQERNWQVYYYHCDHLGTPRELTGEDGALHWQASYRTWGNTLKVQASGQVRQNLRFQGQYFDEETGLHYNRFRYYDPDIGRFVSQDPIGLLGGANTYQYAPNPTIWIDLLGLVRCPRSVLGRKVYQDDSLIDPNTPVSKMNINQAALNSSSFDKMKDMINNGATNVDLMEAGYAPFGPDGKQVNLHHILGEEPGPMVELSASTHQKNKQALHGLIEDGNSFRNNNRSADRGYDKFRRNYWKQRAKDFKC
jgi:RHS repeat-associated protein